MFGRPDLVPRLKAMSLSQLSAYCTAVLALNAGLRLEPLPPDRDDDERCCDLCGAPLPACSTPRRRYCEAACNKAAYRLRRRMARAPPW